LSHPSSVQLLSNCLNGSTSPSAKSKSDFESKTAAIHAEASAQATYDLKDIKADALWLSQKADIDEISALRIAVLEWQNRPAARLLSGFADEESTSLQSAAGVENFRMSLAGPSFAEIFSQNVGREDKASDFVTEGSRRMRLRNLYLSERTHIVKTARKLFTLFLNSNINEHMPKNAQNNRINLLCQLGAAVFKDKLAGDECRSYIQTCIKAIQSRLSALEGDGGWLGSAESSEAVEDTWRTALVEEISHIVQTLFLQLQASTELPSADLFLSWLRLMGDYNFLESLQVVSSVTTFTKLLYFRMLTP
jgi:nuclear pore complex protein Nup188